MNIHIGLVSHYSIPSKLRAATLMKTAYLMVQNRASKITLSAESLGTDRSKLWVLIKSVIRFIMNVQWNLPECGILLHHWTRLTLKQYPLWFTVTLMQNFSYLTIFSLFWSLQCPWSTYTKYQISSFNSLWDMIKTRCWHEGGATCADGATWCPDWTFVLSMNQGESMPHIKSLTLIVSEI